MSERYTRREFLKQAGAWTAACAAGAGCGLGALEAAPGAGNALHPARFWKQLANNRVQCCLCPRGCVVAPNERGACGARENRGGTYCTMVYGKVCTQRIDPIEKDPLHHVRPGTRTLGLATASCNLTCKFCINWEMAQFRPEDRPYTYLTPAQVVAQAQRAQCGGIAYTYTEPVNFIEYALDVAAAARPAGLLNVCHTAAYVQPEPLRALCAAMDAINVDLKGFTDSFYQEVCGGHLQPVLDALKLIRRQGTWLEITYLVLPTLNDKPDQIRAMCEWIKRELGPDTPIHFTRFTPAYRLKNLPATSAKTLEDMRKVAFQAGLRYTYIGNLPGHAGESTYCPNCNGRLVWRVAYQVRGVNVRQGRCPGCGLKIPGMWS
jgi:pyruvate formate lyase activating enzyme